MINPAELLYSLPTIADGVPSTVPGSRLADESNAAILHEDYWRDVEFASQDDRPRIEAQLEELRAHMEEHRVGLGFRHVYVRPNPPEPLAGGALTTNEVVSYLKASGPMPVYIRSGSSVERAQDAFAAEVPGVGFVYGSEFGGRVGTLGLSLVGPEPELGELDGLARLSERYALFLVDWLRREIVESRDAARLRAWIATAVHDDQAPAP
jgi:hypothetical protein